MAELAKGFELPNKYLQQEAANKLVDTLINSADLPLPTYQALLSGITHESPYVSEVCSNGLFLLVQRGKINVRDGINDLLNCVPSLSKCSLYHVIKKLSELLLLSHNTDVYIKQKITHPLVTVINLRNEVWQEVIYHVFHVLETYDQQKSSHEGPTAFRVFQIFWPLFLHVLLLEDVDSVQMVCVLPLYFRLVRFLKTCRDSTIGNTLFHLMVSLLPCYPHKEKYTSFVYHAFEQLILCLDHVASFKNCRWKDEAPTILEHLLSFYAHLRQNNITSLAPYMELLALLLARVPVLVTNQTLLLVLGWLLASGTQEEQTCILSLLGGILDSVQAMEIEHFDEFKLTLKFLIFPLVQLSSMTNKEIEKMARVLLHKTELVMAAPSLRKVKSTNTPVQQKNYPASSGIGMLALILGYQFFLEKLQLNPQDENRVETCVEWLDSWQKRLNNKQQVTEFVIFFLGAFVLDDNYQVRCKGAQVISKIASISPFGGLSFLPLLLYQLAHEPNAEIHLTLLNTITTLATHQACVGPVLRIIVPLTEVTSMKSIAVRLLTQVWQLQERTFPRLHQLLNGYSPQDPLELRISMAASIRDICKKKPTRGRDLIACLSKIISQDQHPSPVALGLQALTTLCAEDELDFKTAWSVISKSLGNETRPIVQAKIAEFFACGASEVDDIDEVDEFYLQIVRKLWNFAQSPMPIVRKEAFKALTIYAKANINSLGSQTVAAEFAHLLKEPNESARKEVENLVDIVLKCEVSQRRSRVTPVTSNSSLELLSTIPAYLKTQYDNAASRPSVRSGIAGAMLYSFSPPPVPKEANKLAQVPRRYIASTAAAYRRALLELLTDISSRDEPKDWLLRLISIPGWLSFMKACTDACIQGEIADASMNGEELDERGAVDKVVAKMVKLLSAKCDETPKTAENAVIALASLALALPSYAYNHVEKIADILKELFVKGAHEWIQYGCSISIGLLAYALQSTDRTRLQEFLHILTTNLHENESEWVKFGCGRGLGILASCIKSESSENEADEETKQQQKMVAVIIENLQKYIADCQPNTESKWGVFGCIIGLSHAASALEASRDLDALVKMTEKIHSELESHKSFSGESCGFMGNCLALASLACMLYRLNLIPSTKLSQYIQTLKSLADQEQMDPSLRASAIVGYAAIIQFSMEDGYSYSPEALKQAVDLFSNVLNNTTLNGTVRIAGGVALGNIIGSGLCVPSPKRSLMDSGHLAPTVINDDRYTSLVPRVINDLKLVFENDSDARVCRHVAWVLGSVTRPLPTTTSATGIPTSLSYLPDSSIVRALFSVLNDSLESQTKIPPYQIDSTLRCLNQLVKLPAARWDTLLLNLMKAGFGVAVRKTCIQFAVEHATDPSLVTWLNEWTQLTMFRTLELELQKELLISLPKLLLVFPSSQSRKLIAEMVPSVIHSTPFQDLVLSVLKSCLSEANLQLAVLAEIHGVVLKLFDETESPYTPSGLDERQCQVLENLAACMGHLPLELVSPKLALGGDVSSAVKAIIVLCSLVDMDHQPVNALQSCRSWCISQTGHHRIVMEISHRMMRSLSKLPAAEKSRWLLDSLDAVPMCPNPKLGLHFVGLLCFHWSESGNSSLINQHKLLTTGSEAIPVSTNIISYTMVDLLQNGNVPIADKVVARMNSMLSKDQLKYLHPTLVELLLEIHHNFQLPKNSWNSLKLFISSL